MTVLYLYTTTLFTVSVRSQGDEVRPFDWCSPALCTDVGEDVDPEPAATSKSLIKSFDTVGQSEHLNKYLFVSKCLFSRLVSLAELTEDGPTVHANCCIY